MNSDTALITGAGSGIGLALAREFAAHGHPLVLTSRVRAEIQNIAADLRREHDIEVWTIAADLEEPDAAERIFEACNRGRVTVDILVNNAGLGFRGKFWEIPLDRHLSVVRTNIE